MILALSLTIAAIFGAGAYLLVSRGVIRVAAGTLLISNAAFLYVFSAALSRGRAAIHPISGDAPVTDPLVQALTLTAIVISLGITALLLSLAWQVYETHRTVDLQRIAEMEVDEEMDPIEEQEML